MKENIKILTCRVNQFKSEILNQELKKNIGMLKRRRPEWKIAAIFMDELHSRSVFYIFLNFIYNLLKLGDEVSIGSQRME